MLFGMDGTMPHAVQTNSSKSIKRKLEKNVLDNFSNIIKLQDNIRIKSTVNLLKHLSDNKEKDNEIEYTLTRIIRGMGSSNPSARIGFYTALIGIINFNDVPIYHIFECVEKQLHKSAGNSKGENADIAGGQILACGAIIKSRMWQTASNEEKEKIIRMILNAGKARSYLSLFAYNFVIIALEKEKDATAVFLIIKDHLKKPLESYDLDLLYLLLSIKKSHPNLLGNKYYAEIIGSNKLICNENLDKLCKIVLEIPRVTSLNHPVYKIFCEQLPSSKILKDFIQCVDRNLYQLNRNRLLLVIKLFTIILEQMSDMSIIPLVLSTNFVKTTIDYYKTFKGKITDPEFQKLINNFYETLLTTLKKDEVTSDTKISVLKRLLFYPGTFIFERITKSKLVQQITLSLDDTGVKDIANIYKNVIKGSEKIKPNDQDHWLNNDRLYAAHLLIKLLNHQSVKTENDWKVEQLCFLLDLSLFRGNVNVGCELATSLKFAFFGALNLKLSKLEDLLYILSKVVHHLDSRMKLTTEKKCEFVLKNAITEQHHEMWEKTMQMIQKIEKKKKKSSLRIVFLTLFLNMCIQLFNEQKLAVDSLNELYICYGKTNKKRTNSNEIVDNEIESNNDPLWIEVVVDLFLNLLSHNSHLLRKIINCVFPHLCPFMTPAALQHILVTLDPQNENNPLSNANESSDEDDNDEEKNNEEDEEEESKSEVDSSEEEIDEGEDEKVNEKLRMALQQALTSNGGYQTDEESLDLDEMSESEGKSLDEALSAAFKQYRPNKGKLKKQTKQDEALTHFRIRVLDLINIYLDNAPSMSQTLEIMLPLLHAIEYSIRDEHQKPLLDRLRSCLKKLTALKKFDNHEDIEATVLVELLQSLLDKGTKTHQIVQDMGTEISDCCIFVIRCSDILASLETTSKKDRKKIKRTISEIVNQEVNNYFHRRDSLTPFIFIKNLFVLNWDGLLETVPLVFGCLFEETVKTFKKSQAAELLKLFYSNQRYLSSNIDHIKQSLKEVHNEFINNTINLFTTLCDNPTAKERFICGLFNLLLSMRSSCLNLNDLCWKEVGEIVREYRSHVSLSKDTKLVYNKLCSKLGVPNLVKMKAKVHRINDVDIEDDKIEVDTSQEKKRKREKSKERLKLKKESKKLRLQNLSEGFRKVDFTSTMDASVEENDSRENGV